MQSEYTTVLDAGAAQLQPEPLVIVLAVPVLLLAFAHVAKSRRWRSSTGPLQLLIWLLYLSYAPMVLFQYWTLWHSRSEARDATQVSIEAGPVGVAIVDESPDGLFVETKQRFAVNGIDFEYRHQSLRYFEFLLPQANLVKLPLDADTKVRITYRSAGADKELLRFEIATSDLNSHD